MADTPPPPFLDTNIIVRYLTDDPPELAERAANVIDRDDPLIVSEIVLAESAYVLESVYEYTRAEVVDALMSFIQRRNIQLLSISKVLALEALNMCRGSRRHSFADALLWAEARHHRATQIYTFDRRFPSQDLHISDGSEEGEDDSTEGTDLDDD